MDSAHARPASDVAGTWVGTWNGECSGVRAGELVLDLVQAPIPQRHVDGLLGTASIAGQFLLVTGTARRSGGRVLVRVESDRGERPWLAIDAVLEPAADGGRPGCRGEFFLADPAAAGNEIGTVRLFGAG